MSPDIHDLSEYHRLYHFGIHKSSPSYQFNSLNFDSEKISVRSVEDHLKPHTVVKKLHPNPVLRGQHGPRGLFQVKTWPLIATLLRVNGLKKNLRYWFSGVFSDPKPSHTSLQQIRMKSS